MVLTTTQYNTNARKNSMPRQLLSITKHYYSSCVRKLNQFSSQIFVKSCQFCADGIDVGTGEYTTAEVYYIRNYQFYEEARLRWINISKYKSIYTRMWTFCYECLILHVLWLKYVISTEYNRVPSNRILSSCIVDMWMSKKKTKNIW